MIRYLHHHLKTTLLTSVLLSVSLSTTSAAITTTMAASLSDPVDPQYPGTATLRLRNIHQRISNLTATPGSFDGEWENVRTTVLFAGGLKDLKSSRPGHGYTGHSFNDWNHCDLSAMRGQEAHNINAGAVDGIAYGNQLGPGIKLASLEELGPGGSWSTCMMGCDRNPPADVAHLQFKARIAFKLVWVPPAFERFVLVDDAGTLLAQGHPTGHLPDLRQRQANFNAVGKGKYSKAAVKVAREHATAAAAAHDVELDGENREDHDGSSTRSISMHKSSEL